MNYGMKPNQQQNNMFFMQEFYTAFIEKVIYVFDTNGEINSNWQIVKQKIREEKNTQQLYKFITAFEIKRKIQSKEDIDSRNFAQLISMPTLVTQTSKDEDLFNNSLRKTPTNVRTVQIQFDVLAKMNNQITHDNSPLFSNPAHKTCESPPLQISKNFSSIQLKNGFDQNILNSPSAKTPTLQQQALNKNTKRIIDNIKKRNSTPSSPLILAAQQPKLQKNMSSFQEQSLLNKQSMKEESTEKLANQIEKKPTLKRFTPQQIIRMGSIREADDDEQKEESEQSINKEIIEKLLSIVKIQKCQFKRDTETLNLIHCKFTLASQQNCKNSTGIELIMTTHRGKPTQLDSDIVSQPSSKINFQNQNPIEKVKSDLVAPISDMINNQYQSSQSFQYSTSNRIDKYYPK